MMGRGKDERRIFIFFYLFLVNGSFLEWFNNLSVCVCFYLTVCQWLSSANENEIKQRRRRSLVPPRETWKKNLYKSQHGSFPPSFFLLLLRSCWICLTHAADLLEPEEEDRVFWIGHGRRRLSCGRRRLWSPIAVGFAYFTLTEWFHRFGSVRKKEKKRRRGRRHGRWRQHQHGKKEDSNLAHYGWTQPTGIYYRSFL